MPRPLRVAVIGCGGIASAHHLPCYQQMPDVSVAAISDTDPERLRVKGRASLEIVIAAYRSSERREFITLQFQGW